LKLMNREETDPVCWASPLHRTAWKIIPSVTTDAQGRFSVANIGRDRAVTLAVDGPGIRATRFSVLTRDDAADFAKEVRAKYSRTRQPDGYFFYPMKNGKSQPDDGVLLFDPSPTLDVDPARTVAGVVRDAKTHEPIPNVYMEISPSRFGPAMSATTDSHGRYRIMRADDEPSFQIYAKPSDEASNLNAAREFDAAKALGEVVADFDLQPGITVSGRVVESGTNQPIASASTDGACTTQPGIRRGGFVYYYPLSNNNALRDTPEGMYFAGGTNYSESALIDAEGKFRLAVPPGPGVLLVMAAPGVPMFGEFLTWKESEGVHRLYSYVKLTTRDKNDGAPAGDAASLPTLAGPIPIGNYHTYHVINPPADAAALNVTVNVPRAPTCKLQFVGPEGHPIKGVRVQGLVATPMTVVLDGSEAEAIGLETGKDRQLQVTSGDGKLIARALISTDDLLPKTIWLQRACTITGRLVDQEGKPVKATVMPPQVPIANVTDELGFVPSVSSDEEGRFALGPLYPDLHYSAEIHGGGAWNNDLLGKAFEELVLHPGETRDLGDIQINSPVSAK
jgi:hypothetical protein